MFTIKHYDSSAVYSTYSCDSYRVIPFSDDGYTRLALFDKGDVAAKEELTIDTGDVVYIENDRGKTVDTIRFIGVQ